MKPLKPWIFLTLAIVLNVLFVSLLIWWLVFIIHSFRTINTPFTPDQRLIQKLDTGTYNRLFGESNE